MIWASWNGTILPLEEVRVPALDRGFLFGDSVYEAMRLYAGRLFLREEHHRRLSASLTELAIQTDLVRLEERIDQLISHAGTREGLLYLQITRGAAERRTHSFPVPTVMPNELIWVEDRPSLGHQPKDAAGVVAVTYPDLRWSRRDIKSTNLLGNCLAAEHARKSGAYEAILVGPTGEITEGSHTTVFAVREGKILTCPTGHHILPGITRAFVLHLAQKSRLSTQLAPFHVNDLAKVDEVFLTGTTTEIMGVVTIDGKPVGTGEVGPITRQLAQAYRQEVEHWLSTSSRVTP